MSLHLNRFIERMRGHDARGVKEFSMPMADAKGMLADLTELLLELHTLKTEGKPEDPVTEIRVDGGKF